MKNESVVTTALANSKGWYRIIGITEGTYTLKVEKEGYVTVIITDLKVTSKGELKKDIQLVQQKK